MSYPIATMCVGLAIFAWGLYAKIWPSPEVILADKRDPPPSLSGPNFKFEGPSNNQFNINPAPAAPQRNPNGLYQFGERVGMAVGANIMPAQGRIAFAEVYGVNELNDKQVFEYQDYVLRFISADGKNSLHAAMTVMGVSKTGTVQQNIVPNVLCEIVGKRQ